MSEKPEEGAEKTNDYDEEEPRRAGLQCWRCARHAHNGKQLREKEK